MGAGSHRQMEQVGLNFFEGMGVGQARVSGMGDITRFMPRANTIIQNE